MKFFVDRICGDSVIADNEDNIKTEIPICKISGKIREGCVLIFENGEYTVSEEETAARKKQIFFLQNKIFNDLKNG